MPKIASQFLILLGVVLLLLALVASDSWSSGFSKFFQGTPDNRTLILLVLGALALGGGVLGLGRTPRS